MFDKSCQKHFNRIDNWINEESDWVIESIGAEYVDISVFSPLSGITTNIKFKHKH